MLNRHLHTETGGLLREGSLTALVVTGWVLTVSAQLADGAGPQQARDQDRQPEGVPRQETVAEVRPGHQVSTGNKTITGMLESDVHGYFSVAGH